MLSIGVDELSYQGIRGFYQEEKDSLDVVYLGSSNCLAFWNPMVAWEEYGIATYSYACNSQPLTAAKMLIGEARKTQPNALFVVNINTIGDELKIADAHHLFDYMPFSFDKISYIEELCDIYDFSFSDRIELYIPMIRYHDRWSSIRKKDFLYHINGYKGALTSDFYLKTSTDISDKYTPAPQKTALPSIVENSLTELMDYCDSNDVKILFVTVPRAEENIKMWQYFNSINELVEKRGYPVLDLTGSIDEIGLDLTSEYYNDTHTNYWGSIKFTNFVSQHLIETFGFADKRNNSAYAGWNDAAKSYFAEVDKILSVE